KRTLRFQAPLLLLHVVIIFDADASAHGYFVQVQYRSTVGGPLPYHSPSGARCGRHLMVMHFGRFSRATWTFFSEWKHWSAPAPAQGYNSGRTPARIAPARRSRTGTARKRKSS